MERKRQRPSTSSSLFTDAGRSEASTNGSPGGLPDAYAESSGSPRNFKLHTLSRLASSEVRLPAVENQPAHVAHARLVPCEAADIATAHASSSPTAAQLHASSKNVRRYRVILERLDLPAPPPQQPVPAASEAFKVTKGCGSELTLSPVTQEVQQWAEEQLQKRLARSRFHRDSLGAANDEALLTVYGMQHLQVADASNSVEGASSEPVPTPMEASGPQQPTTPAGVGQFGAVCGGDVASIALGVSQSPQNTFDHVLDRGNSGVSGVYMLPHLASSAPGRATSSRFPSSAGAATPAGLTAMESLPYPAAQSSAAVDMCAAPEEVLAEAPQSFLPGRSIAVSAYQPAPSAGAQALDMAAFVAQVAGTYNTAGGTAATAVTPSEVACSFGSDVPASQLTVAWLGRGVFELGETPVEVGTPEPMDSVHASVSTSTAGASPFGTPNLWSGQQQQPAQRPQPTLLQEIEEHHERLRQLRRQQQQRQPSPLSRSSLPSPGMSAFGREGKPAAWGDLSPQRWRSAPAAPEFELDFSGALCGPAANSRMFTSALQPSEPVTLSGQLPAPTSTGVPAHLAMHPLQSQRSLGAMQAEPAFGASFAESLPCGDWRPSAQLPEAGFREEGHFLRMQPSVGPNMRAMLGPSAAPLAPQALDLSGYTAIAGYQESAVPYGGNLARSWGLEAPGVRLESRLGQNSQSGLYGAGYSSNGVLRLPTLQSSADMAPLVGGLQPGLPAARDAACFPWHQDAAAAVQQQWQEWQQPLQSLHGTLHG
ncbi:hypothetical protein Agub_g8582 [Astrephomene gubernaculifera]|uniref:Uncharacterized protein n=1 Tax=Astrephomene gubernaculifera TaxID=47775 RepID=A0AAD3DRX2_9CHLO|nr:hypothetical protein Agub_g8582 [Astrephomene gubernaculifera]